MNTALMSVPDEPPIHTSANPITGTVQLPLQPFQSTMGTVAARGSSLVWLSHVPAGSTDRPAAMR
jgi:hypothetical protein